LNKTFLDKNNNTPEKIAFSRVIKAHGLRGEVILAPYRGAEESLEKIDTVWDFSDGCEKQLSISSIRPHKGRYIVKFNGIDKIEDTEPLIGSELYTDISFLDNDVLRMLFLNSSQDIKAFDSNGHILGVLHGIIDTGAHPVFVIIMENGKELLIPYVEQFVKEVDIRGKKLVLSPPEGIYEINDF
jgi:16S rRNA processing protein RimM